MTGLTIVSWRDIPAQVIQGKGRRAVRHVLDERFEKAIDRAAMKAGLKSTDDYLAEWRKTPAPDADGAGDAATLGARIEAEYDDNRLRALIDGHGWENPVD